MLPSSPDPAGGGGGGGGGGLLENLWYEARVGGQAVWNHREGEWRTG